jgi:hypothetical protein
LDFPIGYILASSHYTDAYGLDPNDLTSAADRQLPLPAILAALMMTRRLVFVGFGHADQYIADVLERVADTTWDWEQTIHFAILPVDPTAPDADRRLAEKLMSRMGIATIFYQTTNGDHTERDRLVHKIAEDVESRCGSSSKKALSGAPIVARNLPRWATAANTRALMTERVE